MEEAQAGPKLAGVRASAYTLGEDKTPYKDVTTYNNFYEFGTDQRDPAAHAGSLRTRPWTVTVEGEVRQPRIWDIDALLKADGPTSSATDACWACSPSSTPACTS